MDTGDSQTGGNESSPQTAGIMGFLSSLATRQAVENASKYNPIQGIKSVAELSNSLRKEMMSCVDVREYSKPQSRAEVTTRIKANLKHFRLIYSTTVLFFFVYFLLTSPLLLGGLLIIAALWVYFFQITDPEEVLNIAGYELGKTEKFGVLLSITLLTTVFGGLFSYIFYVGVTSSLFILGHASLRNEIETDPLDALADVSDQDNFV